MNRTTSVQLPTYFQWKAACHNVSCVHSLLPNDDFWLNSSFIRHEQDTGQQQYLSTWLMSANKHQLINQELLWTFCAIFIPNHSAFRTVHTCLTHGGVNDFKKRQPSRLIVWWRTLITWISTEHEDVCPFCNFNLRVRHSIKYFSSKRKQLGLKPFETFHILSSRLLFTLLNSTTWWAWSS